MHRRKGKLVLGYLYWEEREGGKVGRPPSPSSGPSHQAREEFSSRHPLHVTLKVLDGLPSLRGLKEFHVIREAFREGSTRPGRLVDGEFRLVHYSVQSNHIHLLVEARDRQSLARGICGLNTRIGKGLNKLWGRKGKVFAHRYHVHVLKTPSEVRNAIQYLYRNAEKHGRKVPMGWADPCTSIKWFDGFDDYPCSTTEPRPVAEAKTWLLSQGWRRAGRLRLDSKLGSAKG